MRVHTIVSPLLLATSVLFASACGASSSPTETGAPAGTSAASPTSAPAGASPEASAAQAAGATGESVAIPPAIRAVVDAPDRAEADKKLDAGRHPAELLAFAGMKEGMKAAELMVGFGYTAELLARAVGPSGAVYGQNNKFVLERFAEKGWSERLAKPVMKNVVRVDRELDEPLPPAVKDLDAVFMVLFYHDTVWQKVDRAKMNRSIFNALKPGGVYVIVDHSSRPGAGVTEVLTLHRIEEKVVREEVEAAGFKLAGEASFLKSPSDKRDWNASPMSAGELRGTSDRFVLKFVKPGG
jgi:predicted methyltransferase